MDIREVINPHDKITIDCADEDAARLAVLVVGNGAYGIENCLPLLLLGGSEEWAKNTFGKSLQEWADTVSEERLATALESMSLVGERSSISDPVGHAHRMAEKIRQRLSGLTSTPADA